MDKARRPVVIRTWAVERTRALYQHPQNPKVRRRDFSWIPPRSRRSGAGPNRT